MLQIGTRVLDLDIGKGVGAAAVADQQGVALGVIARTLGPLTDPYQAAIGLLTFAGGDALGNDGRTGVAPQMDHLGAGVGLLTTLGDGDRVEFANRVVPAQDAAGVFPGDRRTRLDLGPGDLGARSATLPALGHEVVDAATALGIAGIPILDGRVFDLGIVHSDQLHHRGVKLVLVALRRRAAFEIADVAAGFGDDQCSLELASVACVDSEIGAELHWTAHALRDIDEGAVAEDRGVEAGVVVVGMWNHRAQILFDQLRMLVNGLGNGAEDDARVGQRGAEGRGDRDAVEHGIHGDPGERLLLLDRNAELLVGLEQGRIDLVEALGHVFRTFRGREVGDRLEIDGRVVDRGPVRGRHGQPVAIGLEPPLGHELRFAFTGGDGTHHLFVQTGRQGIGLDLGHEPMLVLGSDDIVDSLG